MGKHQEEVKHFLLLPEVTLFPGNYVEDGGDDEEGAEPHAVHPCCDLLPAVVREPMEEGTAHDGRNNQELPEQKATVRSLPWCQPQSSTSRQSPAPAREFCHLLKLTHQYQKFIDVSGIA